MDQIVRQFDSVTVFGGASLDVVAQSAAPPVMGASNPGRAMRIPGGVGFNVAHVLARLGVRTRLVTRVGSDPQGKTVIEAAHAAGIDTSAISQSVTAPTAAYHATLDDTGNLIIGIAAMDVISEISPAQIGPAATAAPERDFWVVDANLDQDTLAFLAVEANNARRPITALTVSPAKARRLSPLLDRLSYLFTNRREGAVLVADDPDDANIPATRIAGTLARTRTTKVVVTNGNEPLAAASGTDVRSYAPFRAAVSGVNGAGDAFAAGVIRGLASGHALNDAIRFGLAASAMTVEAGSVVAAVLSEDALAERMGAGPRRQMAL